MEKIKINEIFEKGERYALDQIYDYQGIIPQYTYDQDCETSQFDGGDGGEIVAFTKTVTINATITVTG